MPTTLRGPPGGAQKREAKPALPSRANLYRGTTLSAPPPSAAAVGQSILRCSMTRASSPSARGTRTSTP